MSEESLLSAADKFIDTHNAWAGSDTVLLTDDYEAALLEMIAEFEAGDLPENCRSLAAAVSALRDEWKTYELEVTKSQPMPKNPFWEAVERVIRERHGAVAVERKPLESVALLFRQNVSPRQIALIYSHDGVGPFMKNGIPQPHLVEMEHDKPGSVIPEGWTHPAEQARLEEAARLQKLRLTRLQQKASAAPHCPETVEELLRQKVTPNQIADMTGKSLAEILKEADALGIKPESQAERDALYRQHNPILPVDDAAVITGLEDEVDEDETVDESDAEPEHETDDVDSLIIEAAATGRPATEIAKELDITVQKVTAVLRQHRKATATTEQTTKAPA